MSAEDTNETPEVINARLKDELDAFMAYVERESNNTPAYPNITADELKSNIDSCYTMLGYGITPVMEIRAKYLDPLQVHLNKFEELKSSRHEDSNIPTNKAVPVTPNPIAEVVEETAVAEKPAEVEIKAEATVVHEEEPQPVVEEKQIPAPKVEQQVIPHPVIKDTTEPVIDSTPSVPPPAPVEEATVGIALEEPTVEKQNIVVATDDIDIEPPVEFDEDSDNNVEREFVDEDDEPDDSVKEAIVEESPEADEEETDMEFKVNADNPVFPIKTVALKRTNNTMKTLEKLNTDKLDLSLITMFDPETDENIRSDFFKARNDLIATPRTSRVMLLGSNHYEELSAYSNWDMGSIGRINNDKSKSFAQIETALYNSVYSHVTYVSYSKTLPSFEDWAKNIMYPDYRMLFYAIYDANSTGPNSYVIDCPHCGKEITIKCENRDLFVGVPKSFKKNELEEFIRNKNLTKDFKLSEYADWAKNTRIRKILPRSKIIIEFGVPTLFDYLQVINTAEYISASKNIDLNVQSLYSTEPEDQDDNLRMRAFLYTRKIGVPDVVDSNSGKVKYIAIKDYANIISFLNGIDPVDFKSLFTSTDVLSMFFTQSTQYFVNGSTCPECKEKIRRISFDPKDSFFLMIQQMMTMGL